MSDERTSAMVTSVQSIHISLESGATMRHLECSYSCGFYFKEEFMHDRCYIKREYWLIKHVRYVTSKMKHLST